jgi:hypothetical protein
MYDRAVNEQLEHKQLIHEKEEEIISLKLSIHEATGRYE